MAARRQSSPASLFDAEPTAMYSFVPARLNTMLRVECPPVGKSSSCSGAPRAFRSPLRYSKRTIESVLPTYRESPWKARPNGRRNPPGPWRR
jgi:hypothetical protein